jgi:hypothetical protein
VGKFWFGELTKGHSMFDKKEYWKNRKAGKRGQGEEPRKVVRHWPVWEWQRICRKLSIVERKKI